MDLTLFYSRQHVIPLHFSIEDSLPQTLIKAAFNPIAAFSTSFLLNPLLKQIFKLGSGSKVSCPLNLLALVIKTP
jgi:hypothetical protein